ncbi:MAG: L,D-transpeptidase [Leptolyngbyaceae cyanobacterium bins.302]|nr:L,D-transpeptidase [Leptolyngbyaceae cyanobacterium bins.302]
MKRKSVAIASVLAILTAINAGMTATYAQTPISPKVGWVAPKAATMRLTPTTKFTSTGERVLHLDLFVDGKLVQRIQAVSGKPGVQRFRLGRDSKAGSREPLPQGVYRVGAVDRNGGLPYAMGDTFIPITPLFSTARSGIGIHRDADRHLEGGSGTIGCLGVLSQSGIDSVADFVNTYRVKTLTVDYGLVSDTIAGR